MAVVATLLASAIAIFLVSVVFHIQSLRIIGFYLVGGAVLVAFLPLILLFIMHIYERIVKRSEQDE